VSAIWPADPGVRVARHATDELGEGPHWAASEGVLHRVDILAPAIRSFSPDAPGAERTLAVAEPIGAVVPRRVGGFVAALASGIVLIDADGTVRPLANPESDRPGNRFNDGKCDARGRFWIGSMASDASPGAGALWRVDPDGTAVRMLDGVDIANGLGWSPDDARFYFTDSGCGTIDVFDFDAERGALGERRPFARVDENGVPGDAAPDGLAVDAEGFVWSAHWDGGRLVRHDPDGRVDRVVRVPVPRPTSCAFGGDDGRTLFVTSARIGLSEAVLGEAPLSGSVLAIDLDVGGLPEAMFGTLDE